MNYDERLEREMLASPALALVTGLSSGRVDRKLQQNEMLGRWDGIHAIGRLAHEPKKC